MRFLMWALENIHLIQSSRCPVSYHKSGPDRFFTVPGSSLPTRYVRWRDLDVMLI